MGLRTKISRAFFVILCLLVFGSIAGWYWAPTGRYVYPTEFYYWTEYPTNPARINMTPRPWNTESARDYKMQCNRTSGIAGATWRGVELCNAAVFDSEQFSVAYSYFKEALMKTTLNYTIKSPLILLLMSLLHWEFGASYC